MKLQKCHTRAFIQAVEKLEINLVSAVIIMIISVLLLSENLWAATRTAATCSQSDVGTAITAASAGDIVSIPAGDCVWGASGTFLSVNKVITLKGAGQGQTRITLSDTGGTYTNGTIRISAAATVRGMTIIGSNVRIATAFSTSTADGWRITDIAYNGGTSAAWYIYAGSYGLIDNNNITGAHGSAELIFVRGPTNSWQTPHSIGGAENVFIEDNTFNGLGYVTDCNSNARCVVRYNTITGSLKVDGHGKASNTPARSVRHMEVYNNVWTLTTGFWTAIEMRGGGGMVFNNIANTPLGSAWFYLTDYAATTIWPNFANTCQCPANYPIDDQIGVGMDPKSGGSEPMYLWNNTKNGLPWSLSWKSTASCTATCGAFAVSDIIKADRDYFLSSTKPAAVDGYTPYGIYLNGRYYHPLQRPVPPSNTRIN
jgi:hypothetical protein